MAKTASNSKINASKKAKAPAASTNKSKTTPKDSGKTSIAKKAIAKKSKGKEKYPSYKRGIFKILKEGPHQLSISANDMTIMNDMVNDMFEAITKESRELLRLRKAKKLSEKEVNSALKLIFPRGDLLDIGIREGEKQRLALHGIHEEE